MSELFERLHAAVREGAPVALATVVAVEGEARDSLVDRIGRKLLVAPDGDVSGDLGSSELSRVVVRDALGELAAGRSELRHYGPEGEARQSEVSVFIESFAPPPRMIIFGAVDFTAALVRVAKVLGYRVDVCDARAIFATKARFPEADEVVTAWPQDHLGEIGGELGPRDAVCVLTHDAKFDVPALVAALETSVGYIGCMGSRRTCAQRNERLVEAGVDAEGMSRIHSPIGLDLGARTPEETAISICSEIISLRSGRANASLRDAKGPIHSS